MNKPFSIFIFLMLLVLSCNTSKSTNQEYIEKEIKEHAEFQLNFLLQQANSELRDGNVLFPRSFINNHIEFVQGTECNSGFFPGILWQMYRLTEDESWKNEAEKFTNILQQVQFNNNKLDSCYNLMASFGLGYQLTQDQELRETLIQAAKMMASRFNEKVGSIRSWNSDGDQQDFRVSIDNLMNLELLFWAWNETGETVFYNIACSHANNTIKNQFRTDYSTWHVVNYDSITGEVRGKTNQYESSAESCYSLSQAKALYGFTMIYRETKESKYLKQAEKIADFILNHSNLPDNSIPYREFSAPGMQDEVRDVKAAAIMASALLELSEYLPDNTNQYRSVADIILRSLSSDHYLNKKREAGGFLLKQTAGSKLNDKDIDMASIYTDYYFLEALVKKLK
jgi:unsaturated chondroitin disaccharide hydrolase